MTDIKPPRLERFGPLVLAGFLRHHRLPRDTEDMYRAVAAQWREFAEVAHVIPALPPRLGHGVALSMVDGADHIEYFCGFVVPSKTRVPQGFDTLEIALLQCAVFQHTGHVALLRSTVDLVFGTVLPLAGLAPAGAQMGAPQFIQRYNAAFNPETGLGGLELLVPLKD
jgi:AraC family transcriptional regulator